MKHLYFSFSCFIFLLFYSNLLANSPLRSNEAVGGIINSYAAVSNITTGNDCFSTLTVDDATGFVAGDFAWIIQMQGANINESNSSSFGDITSLNSAGLFEKVEIASINDNQITTSASLLNSYQITGKVQIVNIPEYVDAEVTTDVVPMPWDGNKGGVLAFEVTGTLTLQANIDASMSGFRGGITSNSFSDCGAFNNSGDYYYDTSTWESEGKGEGIAAYIAGKEYGRGAQANGGGGGNDHNSGGGGGAGFVAGGIGGENLDPGFFNCHGNNPGIGGKAIAFTDFRFFLGGGGGAGSENNNQATHGGVGGGIILLSANMIIPNGFSIQSNGEDNVLTQGLDGGGGGGGGGAILLQANSLTGVLNVEAKGGMGSDTKNLNQNRCMGPGGGGGGGVIYTNINSTMLTTFLEGGQAGIVTLSNVGCNGSHNNGLAGDDGAMLPLPNIPFNPGANSGSEMYAGCENDGYSVMVNGTNYNESNPSGTEVLMNQYGCDSTVTISLNFTAGGSSTINSTLCEGESFVYEGVTYDISSPSGQAILPNASSNGCDSTVFISLDFLLNGSSTLSQSFCWDESFVYNGTEYNISMPSGQEVLDNASANGCDSIVNIDLTFSPEMMISETANNDEVTIVINGGIAPFDISWDNGFTGATNTITESGDYTVSVTDAFGCNAQYSFYFAVTSNEDIKIQYGLDIFPNPAQDILSIQRTETNGDWNVALMHVNGQTVISKNWQNGMQLDFDVSDLPKGIYVLNIYSDEINFAEKVVVGK